MKKFKFLTGDVNWQEYGGKFISKKLNNGEFDYYLIIEVINWNEHDRYPEYTYNVSLSAVSPTERRESLKSAAESWGMTETEIEALGDEAIVDCLSSYGVKAQLWDDSGNNLKILMREAHRQAELSEMLFGFYMDRYQNRIGSTGWDFIKGDVLGGLNR